MASQPPQLDMGYDINRGVQAIRRVLTAINQAQILSQYPCVFLSISRRCGTSIAFLLHASQTLQHYFWGTPSSRASSKTLANHLLEPSHIPEASSLTPLHSLVTPLHKPEEVPLPTSHSHLLPAFDSHSAGVLVQFCRYPMQCTKVLLGKWGPHRTRWAHL